MSSEQLPPLGSWQRFTGYELAPGIPCAEPYPIVPGVGSVLGVCMKEGVMYVSRSDGTRVAWYRLGVGNWVIEPHLTALANR